MAKLVTLASLRLQAQQRADMVNSNFIDTSEWNGLINSSATELYDLLTTVYSDYYFKTGSLATDGINDTYPLPADFYKLLGVDQVLSGTTGPCVTVHPYQFGERNNYVAFNQANVTFNLPYIPVMPALVSDTDTFDGINGWEEYITVDVAIKALTKEESSTTDLERAKAALIQRINGSAPSRDVGEPAHVTDIHARNHVGTYYRYRILGNSIKFVQSKYLGPVVE